MKGSFFKIAASFVASCAFPLIGSYLAYWCFRTWFLDHTWVTEPFHGVLEAFGACASLIVAVFLLLLARNSRTKSHYVWLSCGMLFMGILDLFHGSLPLTTTSAWLRSVAIFGSGFLFLLIWLPDSYTESSPRSHLPAAAAVTAFLVALLSLALPSYVPLMVKGNEFTFISRAMHALGGVFCLLSALNLAFRYRVTRTTDDLVMFNILLLLSSSALVFSISIRYGLIWWLFHVIKVSAYVVALFYVFLVYQRAERLLQENRDELERRVNERTAKLRESEKRFRLLYENTPVPYMSIDEGGRIVEVNRKWLETFLYSNEEVVGTSFVDYLAPGYSDVFLDRFSSFKATGELRGQECEMVRKDGTLCTVVLDGNVLRDQEGRFDQSYYALHDITDRKRAEKAVEQSRELLRVVINSLPVGIFYVDPERLFLFNNKTHNRWWARPGDVDLAGCTVDEIWGDLHPVIQKRVESAMCGQELSYQDTIKYRDGVTRDVSADFIPHVGPDGQVLGVVGLITDISESKRHEKALDEMRRHYKLILSSAWEGIFGLDKLGNHTFVNPSAARMLGYTVEELIGKHSHSTWHYSRPDGSPYPEEDCTIYATLRDGTVHHMRDEVFWRKDGSSFLAECMSAPIVDDGKVSGAVVNFMDVTGPRKARLEIIKTRERLELALNGADLGTWDFDVAIGRAKLDERSAEIIGYTLEEIEPTLDFWQSLFHPDDKSRVLEILRDRIEGNEDFVETEYRVQAKSGEYKWVLTRGRVVKRDERGRALRMSGTFMDITRRKRTEDALRTSENTYRTLAENIPGIVYKVHLDQPVRMEFLNSMVQPITGFTQDELKMGEVCSIDPLIIPEDKAEVVNVVKRALEKNEPFEVEYRIKSKIGEIRHLLEYGRPIKGISGPYSCIDGVIFDITERKRIEEALRESEQRNRLLIEESPVGIVISQNGKLIYVNPAFLEIFGYDGPDEALGLSAEGLVAPEDRELIRKRRGDRLEGKSVPMNYEVRGLKKNGKIFDLAIWPRPINYLGQPVILIFCADRSEPKSLRTQLFQAQKMEAVGTLAGGIAHDFNNLLQIVLGYSEFMLQRKKEGEKGYADLQKIIQAGNRGTDLAKGLLTFSRKIELKYAPVNLNEEILQVQSLLSRTIPKTIKIDPHLSVDLEPIQADSSQINQILMNLGINARDAMPDGGTLIFETENIELDEEYCRTHFATNPGRYVLLTVSDTGHGMDKETLAHIFEPFFTTKEEGKGTGLGLATVYGIVKQHDGHIMCYSEPGHGTTFKIYLPAIQMEKHSEAQTSEIAVQGGTETILVVDDDDVITDLVSKFLNSLGYEVIVTANGKEALEIYQREGERISLVILDLIMPEMDGRQCLDQILRINPKAKVLIASGYSLNGQAKGILALGVKGFAEKPYNMRKLLHKVREILDKD